MITVSMIKVSTSGRTKKRKTYTTGGQVTSHPLGVTVLVLLVAEHLLELVAEGEVQGLGREVSDDVGSVATPQGHDTLVGGGTLEAVTNTGVLAVETTSLQHLILHLVLACPSQSQDLKHRLDQGSPVKTKYSVNSERVYSATRPLGRPITGDEPHDLQGFVIRGPLNFTYLVLDQELDTLDGGGGSLRDGGGDTTHQEVGQEGLENFQCQPTHSSSLCDDNSIIIHMREKIPPNRSHPLPT